MKKNDKIMLIVTVIPICLLSIWLLTKETPIETKTDILITDSYEIKLSGNDTEILVDDFDIITYDNFNKMTNNKYLLTEDEKNKINEYVKPKFSGGQGSYYLKAYDGIKVTYAKYGNQIVIMRFEVRKEGIIKANGIDIGAKNTEEKFIFDGTREDLHDMPGYNITYAYNDYCKMGVNVGNGKLRYIWYINNYL